MSPFWGVQRIILRLLCLPPLITCIIFIFIIYISVNIFSGWHRHHWATLQQWEMNDSVEKDQETELLPVVNSSVAACTKLYKRDHRRLGNDAMSGRSSLQWSVRGTSWTIESFHQTPCLVPSVKWHIALLFSFCQYRSIYYTFFLWGRFPMFSFPFKIFKPIENWLKTLTMKTTLNILS